MHHPLVTSFNAVKPLSKEGIRVAVESTVFSTLKTNWRGMPGRVAAAERREWKITEEVARSNNSGNLSCHFSQFHHAKRRCFLVSGVGIHIHAVSARWGLQKILNLVAILRCFISVGRNYAPSWTILGSGYPSLLDHGFDTFKTWCSCRIFCRWQASRISVIWQYRQAAGIITHCKFRLLEGNTFVEKTTSEPNLFKMLVFRGVTSRKYHWILNTKVWERYLTYLFVLGTAMSPVKIVGQTVVVFFLETATLNH